MTIPKLISVEGFAAELKIDVQEPKSILRHNPEIGVKIKGKRAKLIDKDYWNKVVKRALGQ